MALVTQGTAVTFAPGGSPAFTVTSLASGTGRISARKDQGTGASTRKFLLECKTKLVAASTPTIGEKISVYLVRSDGTDADAALGSSDADLTDAQVLALRQTQWVGDIIITSVDPTVVQTFRTVVEIPNRYYSVVWVNRSATALSATGGDHTAAFMPLDESSTDVGTTFVVVKTFTSSSIPNNTQTGGALTTAATGALVCESIILQTNSTGLAGPTNIEISTDNVKGLTGAAAPNILKAVSALGANKTVVLGFDASSEVLPLYLESGKKLYIDGDDGAGTGAGTVDVVMTFRRVAAGASIDAA